MCKYRRQAPASRTASAPILSIFWAGVAIEIALLGILGLGDLRQAIPSFLALYAAAFLAYLWSAREMEGTGSDPTFLILAFALVFRATLFLSEPSLSDDIYRYVWDGAILNHGVDPYRYPPQAAELAPFRDTLYPSINHKDIGTPYGPLTLAAFAFTERIAHSVYAMKVPFILCDIAIILLLLRMLTAAGLPRGRVLLYAWNPLVLVEVAGSGHNDPLAIVLMLAALYLLQHGRAGAGALGLGLALSAKYLAVLFLPALRSRMSGRAWALGALVPVMVFLPFLGGLEHHGQSLMSVGARWRFNDSLFSLLHAMTGSLPAAKMLAGGAFLAVAIHVWRARLPATRGAFVLIAAALLLTSTLQPWYLLWLVPLLCLYPNRAWILLTGLVVLSYHVLIGYAADGVWDESPWIKAAIYLPFYGVLLADGWRGRRASRAGRQADMTRR
ncbi:MAG: hypothetical protein GWO03_00900 [Gammaproteobacteria bacterium]|nr:hypothetical protein [Gammaproteobacteria bacterium]